jgi:hypothetical protein
MVRTLTVLIGVAMSLMVARDASATNFGIITPVDLDLWADDIFLVRSHTDVFNVAQPPPLTSGAISTDVFFDGFVEYTYVHTVTPSLDGNILFKTEFNLFDNQTPIRGFNTIAGWSFSDALRAGGTGTDSDFLVSDIDGINNITGQLNWLASFSTPEQPNASWGAFDPIRFFFVSDLPPGEFTRAYGLFSFSEHGTAQSLAPIPEPGSIELLGSGLVGLYAAVRRRQNAKG